MEFINLGVFAHADAGKTTTVERLLFISGTTRKLGSVDDGTAATDSLEAERERGISVRSANAVINFDDLRLNIIDTPGHTDFTAEVQRALLAVDCGVLIVSAAEGVQSQTALFFAAMAEMRLPLIIYVNKTDRLGVETDNIIREIREQLTENVFPLNNVINEGRRDCSTVPRDFTDDETLALCALDSTLAEQFFAEGSLSRESCADALFALCAQGAAYPIIFGSSAQGAGVETLLAAILRLPREKANPAGDVGGKIYKIEHGHSMGKAAYIRLFSGTIKNRDDITLLSVNSEPRTEKVSQIRRFSIGAKLADFGEFSGGDTAVVYGLQSAKVGDIVGEIYAGRGEPLVTHPLFSVKVTDENLNTAPLLAAMRELADEDPMLSCEWAPDEREITIQIMGDIQTEILTRLLVERYGINAVFSPPTIIYKETPSKAGTGFESYTMPKPCWAVVELALEPLRRGAGYMFESVVKGGQIPYKYQTHIKTTLPEAMKQGMHGWEVTDVKITLTGGGWHFIHTHPQDFFLATPIAFMDGMRNCGSTLLEPVIRAKITISDELTGRVIGDITNMRGTFDTPAMTRGTAIIDALLPLAEAADYAVRLNALSQGKARYATSFDSYRPCPPELGKTAKRRGVNPLDRAKWILKMRQAL